jgi:hypothetical protein
MPVKGCKFKYRPMPLSRDGFLSCHTCCDTGPQFFRSHAKDRPIQSPLTTRKGMWRIYSNWIITVSHSVASYDTQGDAEDSFLPGSSRVHLWTYWTHLYFHVDCLNTLVNMFVIPRKNVTASSLCHPFDRILFFRSTRNYLTGRLTLLSDKST